MYGKGNSGPAIERWQIGDRIIYIGRGRDRFVRGTVSAPRRDPNAAQQHHVWVRWDDGQAGYTDPGLLDVA